LGTLVDKRPDPFEETPKLKTCSSELLRL
jgi:hypothetical protein